MIELDSVQSLSTNIITSTLSAFNFSNSSNELSRIGALTTAFEVNSRAFWVIHLDFSSVLSKVENKKNAFCFILLKSIKKIVII